MTMDRQAHGPAQFLRPIVCTPIGDFGVREVPVLLFRHSIRRHYNRSPRAELVCSLVAAHWGRNDREQKKLEDSCGIHFLSRALTCANRAESRGEQDTIPFAPPIKTLD